MKGESAIKYEDEIGSTVIHSYEVTHVHARMHACMHTHQINVMNIGEDDDCFDITNCAVLGNQDCSTAHLLIKKHQP